MVLHTIIDMLLISHDILHVFICDLASTKWIKCKAVSCLGASSWKLHEWR